jgi:hypothetical protein
MPRSLSIISIVRPEALRIAHHAALFSFEGTTLEVLPSFSLGRGFKELAADRSVRRDASNNADGGEFLENCIEKNFHVSHTRHIKAATQVLTFDFVAAKDERVVQFCVS